VAIITLTTDYGVRDHYAGVVKGVILSLAPKAQVVDVTHDVPPHDVPRAAFILRQIWSRFPEGTVHLVVVDPGVGTDRPVIVGRYGGRYVVAPDNGLVTYVHREVPMEALHVVEDRRYLLSELSATFHGRDIMAPVAAHLVNGVPPRAFGRFCDRLEMLPTPARADAAPDGYSGQVLHVDHFGTLVTNIRAEQIAGGARDREAGWVIFVGEQELGPIRETFASVPVGAALAVIGGSGFVEIAVNQGRAVDRFGRAPIVGARRTAGAPADPV